MTGVETFAPMEVWQLQDNLHTFLLAFILEG